MKRVFQIGMMLFVFVSLLSLPAISISGEYTAGEKIKKEKGAVKLEDITVTATKEKEQVVLRPSATIINVEKFKMPGTPQNVMDVLKTRAIIDFRGGSDLFVERDPIYMRGFSGKRFIVALDDLSIQNTHHGSDDVDYNQISFPQIESIEIMPGPHSPLYPGKSIGGVLNVKTKGLKRYETIKPDFKVTTSYKSYNTQNHSMDINGGIGSFIYGLWYQKSKTDGYLRNHESDLDIVTGRVGYILPSDGYIYLTASYSDSDYEEYVINDPARNDYDPGYPATPKVWRSYESWQKPAMNKKDDSYRLAYKQPTPIGLWTLGAYYHHQHHTGKKWDYINKNDKDLGIERISSRDEKWREYGGRVQDEIPLFEDHLITVGFDMDNVYRNLMHGSWDRPESRGKYQKIIGMNGIYIQDRWKALPRLTLTPGLRYENADIYWRNWSEKSQTYKNPLVQKDFIKKDYNQVVPKFFATYELDDLSDVLRDTSISAGVSKIWTPVSYCII